MQLHNDIRNYRSLPKSKKLYLLAFLVALSAILSVVDYIIPKPLPFIKLGIANVVTLILVLEGRIVLALETAFFRTLIASMIMGTFLSYTYLLSASGAILAVIVSAAVVRIFGDKISAIGVSVWGAFASVIAQGLIVGLFFGFDRGLIMLLSVFMLLGVANGIIIGLVARFYYKNLKA